MTKAKAPLLSARSSAIGQVILEFFGPEARSEWGKRLKAAASLEERERIITEAEKRLRSVLKVIIHG